MLRAICLMIVLLASVRPATAQEWIEPFNGENLDGWVLRGGEASYRVEDGAIVGTTAPDTPNTFLCTEQTYGDFVLQLEVMVDPALNSGIQIRSHSRPPEARTGRVYGYQVEIDPSDRAWSGGIYDEARRGWLANLEDNPAGREAFRNGEWNRYTIVALGDTMKVWINGVPTAHLRDDVDAEGFIALQVHSSDSPTPLEVRWRNIRLLPLDMPELPATETPTETAAGAESSVEVAQRED